jgi:hypothetical protein
MEYAITNERGTQWIGGYEDFDRALCEWSGANPVYVYARVNSKDTWEYQFTAKWNMDDSMAKKYAPKKVRK